MKKLEEIMKEAYLPKPENLYFYNPVQPGNELNYGINPNYHLTGYHYDKEMFYILDLPELRKNKYVISSYGRIFSFNNNKEMATVHDNGYRRIILKKEDGLTKSYKIHRLVAMIFIPKTLEDIYLFRDIVNHKDTIKSNNYYKNLEWCTAQENTIHAHENNAHGRQTIITKPERESQWGKRKTGEQIGMCTITDEQVHIICQNIIQGKSRKECCIAAGLEPNENNLNNVSKIAGGHRRDDIAAQYGITKENKKTRDLTDRTKFIPMIETMLLQGYNIKTITEILNLGGTYDGARVFVGKIKKNLIKEGKL